MKDKKYRGVRYGAFYAEGNLIKFRGSGAEPYEYETIALMINQKQADALTKILNSHIQFVNE